MAPASALSNLRRSPVATLVACWLLAIACCLTAWWYGLRVWFQQDDFAWLGLGLQVHNWDDFWRAMFVPMAQGTIRPWSERAFFMGLYELFGLNPIPFRLVVFATHFVDLALVILIVRKLTGSTAAGTVAAILWTVNSNLLTPMTWSAAYNQILCGFFLLSALYNLIRYFETGRNKYYIVQWIVFLFGFGALEINVVYPALALSLVLCWAPRKWLATIPLIVPSIAYLALHFTVAKKVSTGVYALKIDGQIPQTLITYWMGLLGINRLPWVFYELPPALLTAGGILLTVALLGVAVYQLTKHRQLLPLFFLSWFLITLAPVLPLPNHISDYYLTIPSIGVAMLGGWSLVLAWNHGRAARTVAAALAAIYLFSAVTVARATSKATYEHSIAVKNVVLGVERANQLHPGKTILLHDVDDALFWNCIFDRPFRLLGITNVYVTPEAAARLTPYPELGDIANYTLPAQVTHAAVDRNSVVVYSAAGGPLRNITPLYGVISKKTAATQTPTDVPVANPLMQYLLGPEWYKVEEGFRWMPKTATLKIGGPSKPMQKLLIEAFCAPEQIQSGPLELIVKANQQSIGSRTIAKCEAPFEVTYDLPASLTGQPSLDITLEVNRTIKPPNEQRDLGLAIIAVHVK